MSVPICLPCIGINCDNPADLATGIDSAIFSALDYSFIVQCPPLCHCPDGVFPQTISILASTIPPVVPPILEPGDPIILRLQGCMSLITTTLAAGSTQAQIAAAAQSMQAQWAGQQALCNALLVPGVTCTTSAFIDVCNDAQNFVCPYNGANINTPAGTYCQRLSTIGLTQTQIAAQIALIKANLNSLAQITGLCSFLHIFCSVTFTDALTGTEWTLLVDNLSAFTFDSSSFQILNNTTNAFLQGSLNPSIAPGVVNVVVLDAQPGVPPAGFYMTYKGVRFFTYPNNLSGHRVVVRLQVCP